MQPSSPSFSFTRRGLRAGVAAVLLVPAATASAQVFFDTPFTLSPVERPEDVAVLDLDADGNLDVVTTGASGVLVHTNSRNGLLTPGVPYPTGSSPESIATGDLDLDGDLDLAVVNREGDPLGSCPGCGTVSVLFNDGSGGFAPATSYSVGLEPVHVAIGDLDGNGTPDLAVVNSQTEDVSLLLNQDGSGVFIPGPTLSIGNDPSAVAIGDFDPDGHADLAVTRLFPVEGNWGDIAVFRGLGDGLEYVPFGTYVSGLSPHAIDAGDVDGDGLTDLVALNGEGVELVVLLNRGGGDFGNGTVEDNLYWDVGVWPQDLALQDLEGDGDLDAVVANVQSVRVLVNDGTTFATNDGYFADAELYAQPLSVAVGDLTGDGAVDLVVPHHAADQGYGYVAVLANRGSLKFEDVAIYEVSDGQGLGEGPVGLAVGDLDGDTDLDIVTVNPGTSDITVVTNDGDGTFGPENIPGAPPFLRPSYGVGANPQAVTLGDLDGDGDLDAVTANHFSATVSVVLNTGEGEFAEHVEYFAGLLPTDVELDDLDGDADLDVIVGFGVMGNVAVLANDGSGVLGAPTSYAAGDRPETLIARDLDGDGDVDVATADRTDGTVSILLNSGGVLSRDASHAVSGEPVAITAGDWDCDGDMDLLAASEDTGVLSVLRNSGDGAFDATEIHPGRPGARSLATADLDGDHDLDVAVANGDFTYTLLMNDGAAFEMVHYRAPTWDTWALGFGDFDGDGAFDLALADHYPKWIMVMPNRIASCPTDVNDDGRVGVDDLVALIMAWGPCSGCAADLDGDGTVDENDLAELIVHWGSCN